MTNEEILIKVAETIRETFGVDNIEITTATIADDIPGWDSLSHTILMLTMEQTFCIDLETSTVYRNVGELVDVISGKVNNGKNY